LGILGLGTGGWVVPIPVGCQEFGGASACQTRRSHRGYAEAYLRPDRISGVDAKQCHGIRASGSARSGLRRRPPSADKGVRMIWKLRETRPPTRGGVPACPTFWSGNHLHSSRARPLTGARNRAGEESDDNVFITYRSPQDFSLRAKAILRSAVPSGIPLRSPIVTTNYPCYGRPAPSLYRFVLALTATDHRRAGGGLVLGVPGQSQELYSLLSPFPSTAGGGRPIGRQTDRSSFETEPPPEPTTALGAAAVRRLRHSSILIAEAVADLGHRLRILDPGGYEGDCFRFLARAATNRTAWRAKSAWRAR
jgi:hypothetical protein